MAQVLVLESPAQTREPDSPCLMSQAVGFLVPASGPCHLKHPKRQQLRAMQKLIAIS